MSRVVLQTPDGLMKLMFLIAAGIVSFKMVLPSFEQTVYGYFEDA